MKKKALKLVRRLVFVLAVVVLLSHFKVLLPKENSTSENTMTPATVETDVGVMAAANVTPTPLVVINTVTSGSNLTSTTDEIVVTSEITPTPVPEVTPTPVPEVTPTPVPEVTPTPVPEVTPTPVPEVTPTPVPEVTPTPTPNPKSRITIVLPGGASMNPSEWTQGIAVPTPTVETTPTPERKSFITIVEAPSTMQPFSVITPVPVSVNTTAISPERQEKLLAQGYELCDLLLDAEGHIVSMEQPSELEAKKMWVNPITAGSSTINNVVLPVTDEGDRLNGRYVRGPRPHEVLFVDGQILQGYSQIPLRLEILNPQVMEQMIGKPADQITARDVVDATVVVKEVDGKYLAAHMAAPGYRNPPEVARLYTENGRYLRLETWDWLTHYDGTSGEAPLSLVFVFCSEQARTK